MMIRFWPTVRRTRPAAVACVVLGVCALAPTRAAAVPDPQPVTSDLVVGSYYFPGHFSPQRWIPFRRLGFPTPLLGYYRDGEEGVMDWHIKWATEHGISFFAFDWYYDWRRGESTDHNLALDRGFLQARFRHLMQFTLMWCNESPTDVGYQEEDMLRLARVLTRLYFCQPNYLRIHGDNVLIISIPERVIEAFGPQGAARVFEQMAQVSRAEGYGGLFPVAKQHTDQETLRAAGFRATTGYNYPLAGMTQEELRARHAPYESLIAGYEEIWQQATAPGSLPYIVPVLPGWDSRPWYLGDAIVRTDPSPRLFARMCANARRYVDPSLRMIIAECWNEFGEGSYLEPTAQTGFGYLDAMRSVFCPQAPVHEDFTPCAFGQTVPVWSPQEIPPATAHELMLLGENMLPNGGMEADWPWVTFEGVPARRSPDAHRGLTSLAIPSGSAVKSQWLLPLPPSRKLQVCLWSRVPTGASLRLFSGLFQRQTWTGGYAELGRVADTAGQWQAYSRLLEVPDGPVTQVDLSFQAIGGECLVDEVSVTAVGIGQLPEDLPSDVGKSAAQRLADEENLLYNGDMESEWGWVDYDDLPAQRVPEAHTGRYALRVPLGTGVKTRWLMPVPPSRRVQMECWVRIPAGAWLEMTPAVFANGVWLGRHGCHIPLASTHGRWQHILRDLTIEDPIARQFNLEFVAHDGECLVDDLTILAQRP